MDVNEWLRALKGAASQGDLPAEAEACTQLSVIYGRHGETLHAAQYSQHALQICSALDAGSVDTAEAAERLAVVLCRAGCVPAAEKTLCDALRKATKAAGVVPWRVAPAQCVLHSALGRLKVHVRQTLLSHEGDALSADPILRAVAFGPKCGVLLDEAGVQFQKAHACVAAVDEAAESRLLAADRAHETLAYMRAHCRLSDAMLLAYRGMGDLSHDAGDSEGLSNAHSRLDALLEIGGDFGLVFGPSELPAEHEVLSLAATVCAAAGSHDEAVAYLDRRLRLAEESDDGALRASAMVALAQCYYRAGDFELAEETLYLAKSLLDSCDEDESLLEQTNALLKRVLGGSEALMRAERVSGAARGVLLCRAGQFAEGLGHIDGDSSAEPGELRTKVRHVAAIAAARVGDWASCARHASKLAAESSEDAVLYVWAMDRLGLLSSAGQLVSALRTVEAPPLLALAARVLLDRMGSGDAGLLDVDHVIDSMLSAPGSDSILADLATRDYFADRKVSRGAMRLVDGPFQLASRTLGKKRGLGNVRVSHASPVKTSVVSRRKVERRVRASQRNTGIIDLTAYGDPEDLFVNTAAGSTDHGVSLPVTFPRPLDVPLQSQIKALPAGGLASAMFPTAPMRLFVDVDGVSYVVTILDSRMTVAQLKDHVAACVSRPDSDCPVLSVQPEIAHFTLNGALLSDGDVVGHALKDGSRIGANAVRWKMAGTVADALRLLGLSEAVSVSHSGILADMLTSEQTRMFARVLCKTFIPRSLSMISCCGVSIGMLSLLPVERLDLSHSDALKSAHGACILPCLRHLSLAYCTGSSLTAVLSLLAHPTGEHALESLDLSGLGHLPEMPRVLSTTLPLSFPSVTTLRLRHCRIDAALASGLCALLTMHSSLIELDVSACVWECDVAKLRPGVALRRLVVSRAVGLETPLQSAFGDRLVDAS